MILLSLLSPAPVRAAGPGAYYFIAVKNGAPEPKGGAEQLDESYKALQNMLKLADAQNVRLTLLFGAQYAVYIASEPARMAELEGWKKTGHEIGAYHEGPETNAWDGYSDLSAVELKRIRKKELKGVFVPGHKEFSEALGQLEPEIKSGCMEGGTDDKFLAAAPPYELCGGPGGRAKSGANTFILVGATAKKQLFAFRPADKAGIETAKRDFSGLEFGVYGAAFKSTPSDFGAFYSWLAFLRGNDPQGLRSRTVSAIIGAKLLDEKEAPAPPKPVRAEKPVVLPQPETPVTEIPRLKPVPSNYGKVGTLIPERRLRRKNPEQRGYCGDGMCDAMERERPGRCPRDCGK